MNSTTAQLLRSLLITLCVSVLFGVAGFIYDRSFNTLIAVSLTTFILQYILFFLWRSYIIYKTEVNISLIEADVEKTKLEQLAKQNVEVICAYCRASNITTIQMNNENIFNCKACNKNNLILMNISTAQVTDDIISSDIINKINTLSINDNTAPIEFRGI